MRVWFFLLEVLFFFLIGAAFLRAWMNHLRVNMSAQPGRFAMALTDWLVQPLRRVLPASLARSRVDWGSLFAAVLFALVYGVLAWLLTMGVAGFTGSASALLLPVLTLAVKLLLRVLLQGLMILVLAYAVLSWVQPGSPVLGTLDRLCAPFMRPLRRLIPPIGGVDLSALVLLILLQIGLIMLA